jgi:transcriptional regulator with XRE-family HTH domain
MEKDRQRGLAIGSASRATANRINAIREAIPMTLQETADVLAKIGHPLGMSALSKIENYKRRIDADDIYALAEVFSVLPGELLPPPRTKFHPMRPRDDRYDLTAFPEFSKIEALPEAEREAIYRAQDEGRREADRVDAEKLRKVREILEGPH